MSTKTRTTYTLITDSVAHEEETFSTKQAAVRAGEKIGEPFIVRTSGGAVVHDSHPAEETQEPAKGEPTRSSGKGRKTAQKDAKEDSKDVQASWAIPYREHGPKHFFKALTQPVLDKYPAAARGTGFVLMWPDAETVAASEITDVWDNALEALREWKKENAAYKRASTKTDAGRKLRYEMEQEFLSSFVKKALR
jgi:hypothetical protein